MTRAKDISKILTDADISGNIDVDGVTNLDVVDIDGAVDMASTLAVGGVVTANGGAVFNEASADVDFRVESNGDANCLFIDGGNNVVGINNNVMSSMSTDSNNLVVGSGSGNEGITIFSANSGTGNIYFADGSSGGDRYRGWVEYFHGEDRTTFGTAGAERLRINSEGSITSNTSVVGGTTITAYHTSAKSAGITFQNSSSGTGTATGFEVALSGSGTAGTVGYLWNYENGDIRFATNNAERMRITSVGRVGIGISPGTSYHFQVSNASGSGVVAYFHATSGVGVYLSNGGNSWSIASDETLKENIVELDKQKSYDNLKNIRAINYKYLIDEDDNTKRIGFIAQDWQAKYPEIIVPDVMDDTKLGLSYTETIPVLLSALQKAQEKIEAMETRITALEGA